MGKNIYVILSRTLTKSGKAIRKITGNEYSHASISLDVDLNKMYSFARYHYNSPLVGGFVHENTSNLTLGKDEDVFIKIFKIPVTDKQYNKLEKSIEHFKRNKNKYMYNLLALVFYPMGIKFKIRDSYICTEFVAQLLKDTGIGGKKLQNTHLTPSQLIKKLDSYAYYEGTLQDYIETVEYEEVETDFFEKENIFFIVIKSIKQIGKLFFRKII